MKAEPYLSGVKCAQCGTIATSTEGLGECCDERGRKMEGPWPLWTQPNEQGFITDTQKEELRAMGRQLGCLAVPFRHETLDVASLTEEQWALNWRVWKEPGLERLRFQAHRANRIEESQS